jgi:hypothetical protein
MQSRSDHFTTDSAFVDIINLCDLCFDLCFDRESYCTKHFFPKKVTSAGMVMEMSDYKEKSRAAQCTKVEMDLLM